MTTIREQALKYASRILIRGGRPVLNVYNLELDPISSSYKRFDAYDKEWLDYVSACRAGRAVRQYDIIEGGIANDRVFETIDLYFSGILSESDALKRLIYVKPNRQICVTSQKVLDECLKFVESENIPV